MESTKHPEVSRVETNKTVALIIATIANFSWPFMGAARHFSSAEPSAWEEFLRRLRGEDPVNGVAVVFFLTLTSTWSISFKTGGALC